MHDEQAGFFVGRNVGQLACGNVAKVGLQEWGGFVIDIPGWSFEMVWETEVHQAEESMVNLFVFATEIFPDIILFVRY